MDYCNKKAVHFGAGNIGLGFIGDLLHDTGYHVVFIDVDTKITDQINESNGYCLNIVEKDYEKKVIDNCSAVSSVNDFDKAIEEIDDAYIITTSVLTNNLIKIAPVLLAGLKRRYSNKRNRINVLACENAVGNTHILKKALEDIDPDFACHLDEVAAFADTEVDRLVLPRFEDGKKSVDIGVDFELAVDKTQLVDPNESPIKGADFTDTLIKYIERKLYIINGGHVFAGFLGYLKGYEIIQNVFYNSNLKQIVREQMKESGMYVCSKYDFTEQQIDNYIEFALNRFSLPGIEDPISRVCRSPMRKMQAGERLMAPAVGCEKAGLDNHRILQGLAAGFAFDIKTDAESVKIQELINSKGIEETISIVTGIQSGTKMFNDILGYYNRIKQGEWIF
ncbi:MAG: hypothetical protein SOX68_04675 [Faecalicoccus sp.]|uniref:mannitol dehydrogenase family protein n=1 Tax=Faecalicoccus sp. TaxID=1971758 RepID=UPI002A804629|nr:hypothetical protein [Faecalicoccus sp.]MDY4278227.1 hypothetical protein [Faecalicoccus sp.]